jgi:hypothetical protein
MRPRRAIALTVIATLPIAAISCSLFTPLGDLQSGKKDGGVVLDTSVVEGSIADGANDSSVVVDAGPTDSGLALLSCNANGLVAYWPMNEGSGSTITDCTQGIVGAFQGSPGPTWGTRGGGGNLEFNGSGNIDIPSEMALQLGGPFTLDGWFRSDGPPDGYTSLFWSFEEPAGFEITESSDGLLYAQVGVDGQAIRADFPEPPPLSTWEHLTAVFEPGVNLRVYLNGVPGQVVSTLEDGAALPNVPAGLNPDGPQMGPVFSSSWTGGIDDVRIFSRALSDDEIAFLAAH